MEMAQKCDVSKAIVRSELIVISLYPIEKYIVDVHLN